VGVALVGLWRAREAFFTFSLFIARTALSSATRSMAALLVALSAMRFRDSYILEKMWEEPPLLGRMVST